MCVCVRGGGVSSRWIAEKTDYSGGAEEEKECPRGFIGP